MSTSMRQAFQDAGIKAPKQGKSIAAYYRNQGKLARTNFEPIPFKENSVDRQVDAFISFMGRK